MIPRKERITRVAGETPLELAEGVTVVFFSNADIGAIGFSTGLGRFAPGVSMPYHTHECGESITSLRGSCQVAVEGRTYHLSPFDSIHVPPGLAHAVKSLDESSEMLVHVAFSSSNVTRSLVADTFTVRDLKDAMTSEDGPERLVRFSKVEPYELSEHAWFRDLFARRLGARGICGGYGRFAPGASLPCHTHLYDESITIVEGQATCLVAGRRYTLGGCDTALVPQGLPHRFINDTDQFMAMIWVYAGDEPERVIVSNTICAGEAPRDGQ
ncbi:MAG: cupin domain-containing protein [Acidobacteriota bacterium]